MGWRMYNAGVAMARVLIGGFCIAAGVQGNWLAGVYGAAECFGGGLALANAMVGQAGDWSLRGLTVSVCYLVGAFVRVDAGEASGWLVAVECCVVALLFYTRWVAWDSYSVGVPCWVELRASGPYRFVRHPQAAASIAVRWVFVLGNASAWNLATGGVYTAAMVLSVMCEESYLRARPEWADYARRVRRRFVPGVA